MKEEKEETPEKEDTLKEDPTIDLPEKEMTGIEECLTIEIEEVMMIDPEDPISEEDSTLSN